MASRGSSRRQRPSTPYERPQGSNEGMATSTEDSNELEPATNTGRVRRKTCWAWGELVQSESVYKCSSCNHKGWNPLKFKIGNFKTHFTTRHPQLCVERGYVVAASASITSNDQLDLSVSRWVLTSNRPFSIVDDPGFRSIIQGLSPSLQLLHRQQLMKSYLPRFSIALKDKVSAENSISVSATYYYADPGSIQRLWYEVLFDDIRWLEVSIEL